MCEDEPALGPKLLPRRIITIHILMTLNLLDWQGRPLLLPSAYPRNEA